MFDEGAAADPPCEEQNPMPIVNRIADLHGEITAWRRDIHAHPELLYDVHRTAASSPTSSRASAATRW